ncbi:MAG: hypothetical protein HZC39_03695 [Chloroflexi bacterium]|nr:hypothetical protein [Chloroflexota bacterium]MBI5702609.1 hypothetical protein [Chloroflexota bacterium]
MTERKAGAAETTPAFDFLDASALQTPPQPASRSQSLRRPSAYFSYG